MKKIFIISLSLVFLVSQYSFAIGFSENSFDEQQQDEEVLMSSPDAIEPEAIPPNPDSPLCDDIVSRFVGHMINMEFANAVIAYILYVLYCYQEVMPSEVVQD